MIELHTVVETPTFLASGLSEAERREIVDLLADNPQAGEKIPGTGGARKLRVAGRGHGKRGGYRVITFYSGEGLPVFLLAAFAKGERVDLAQTERNQLRGLLKRIVETYAKRG